MVGEENETLFIRVWKPLPSIRLLKEKPKRKSPKKTISADGGFRLLQKYKKEYRFNQTCSRDKSKNDM